jgi:hypothetical protein
MPLYVSQGQTTRLDSGSQTLLARLQELDHSAPAVVQNVRRFLSNPIYYEKRAAGENVLKLYAQVGFQGPERLPVDPANFVTNASQHTTLDWWEPSRDGSSSFSAFPGRAQSKRCCTSSIPFPAISYRTLSIAAEWVRSPGRKTVHFSTIGYRK